MCFSLLGAQLLQCRRYRRFFEGGREASKQEKKNTRKDAGHLVNVCISPKNSEEEFLAEPGFVNECSKQACTAGDELEREGHGKYVKLLLELTDGQTLAWRRAGAVFRPSPSLELRSLQISRLYLPPSVCFGNAA